MTEEYIDLLLVGNYVPDRQYSMLQYQEMVKEGMEVAGKNVRSYDPVPYLGKYVSGNKWVGYIDKFVVFPVRLRALMRKCASRTIVHVCDHSNGTYLKQVEKQRKVLSCHDLIAIRCARGEFSGHSTGFMGKQLQRFISSGFSFADSIICDSNSTKEDLERLFPSCLAEKKVIYLGFNKSLCRLSDERARNLLAENNIDTPEKFILHVGNNAWYKNRMGVLKIFCEFLKKGNNKALKLLLVGGSLDDSQVSYLQSEGVLDRVTVLEGLSNSVVEALYNSAKALLFPSRYEGFGWPPLEAQLCHCPVVCSDSGSLAEIVLDSALTAPWDDVQAHARNLELVIEEGSVREQIIRKGLENVARFSMDGMIGQMCDVYDRLLTN